MRHPVRILESPTPPPHWSPQVIRIQPNEAIYLKVNNKVPGLGLRLDVTKLDLTYKYEICLWVGVCVGWGWVGGCCVGAWARCVWMYDIWQCFSSACMFCHIYTLFLTHMLFTPPPPSPPTHPTQVPLLGCTPPRCL